MSKSKFYKSLFQASKGGLSDPQLLSHLHKGMREKAAKQQNKSRSARARNKRLPPQPRSQAATAATTQRLSPILSTSEETSSQSDEDRVATDDEEDELYGDPVLSRVYHDLQEADNHGELTEPDWDVDEEEEDTWAQQPVVRYQDDEADEDEDEGSAEDEEDEDEDEDRAEDDEGTNVSTWFYFASTVALTTSYPDVGLLS